MLNKDEMTIVTLCLLLKSIKYFTNCTINLFNLNLFVVYMLIVIYM